MDANERIKLARQSLGLSQAKFAEAISISSGYIAGIELKNRKANDRILKLISATFGISMKWLKDGVGEMFEDRDKIELDKIISLFKQLKSEYQQYILKQAENLLDVQRAEKQE
jgi:Predicted transcription factor, homolog of eukaryotic MBF1